ncbi:MAG: hypothetical protein DI598_20580 [Pseudopedobacter saltans]|uniref:DUF2625 domain-containing protein n=1 Tax=Pseudopedobacter saltans TaxID=151895 RepID=A0A2W5E6L4_9SPHI|nr:MAG: hypothetical protein DI598_20580 [Pseudopedobacter saltans]
MKSLEELINKEDPGWPFVKEWIAEAKNNIKILMKDVQKANDALFRTQVTTRSPMGAIIFESGGIVVEDGWIRILGSGCESLERSLPYWNKGKSFIEFGDIPSFFLVADDAVGGFFAINGGSLGENMGKIYYLAPDTLEWEDLDMTYSDFLFFCFSGDMDSFYQNLRWNNWRDDIANLCGDEVFTFYPFLWTKQGKDINTVTRKNVPIEEHYHLTIDLQKQLSSN